SGYGGAVTNANATGTFLGDLGAGTDTLLLKTRINSLNLGRKVTFVVFFGILDADRRASGDNDPDGLSSLGFLPSGEKVLSERVTALGNESAETPGTFRLLGNYPNPFNPSTAIRYELATNAYITLKVHDALGREVARLVDGPMPPGSHTASWTTGDIVPSGVYFVRLSTGEQTQTRPVVLLR
ncbi:MAG: T9SS type A sorting domain-containing protein, partial [Rhodothermales bacterium]|nr:T9SS type A sorting domain-containing protein [Rhodothermales bacterium]